MSSEIRSWNQLWLQNSAKISVFFYCLFILFLLFFNCYCLFSVSYFSLIFVSLCDWLYICTELISKFLGKKNWIWLVGIISHSKINKNAILYSCVLFLVFIFFFYFIFILFYFFIIFILFYFIILFYLFYFHLLFCFF